MNAELLDLQYLKVFERQSIQEAASEFDPEINCWLSDPKKGFISTRIQGASLHGVTVKLETGEVAIVKKNQILKMNSPDFHQCADLADLPFLNEATIFDNLQARFQNWLIYTYSGVSCVAINPYKQLPIYSLKLINYYHGKQRKQVPPHLYAIAEDAYISLNKDKKNQSVLLTGESGAGKSESTKHIIQYFVTIAGANKMDTALEKKVFSACALLEAFGNCKTYRNNNSSRFGKFVRFYFDQKSEIIGANVEVYFLEKSRVTVQHQTERNFHIFYQLLSPRFAEYHEELLLEADQKLYYYMSQGLTELDGVNDAETMELTDSAFQTMSFNQNQKLDLFKCISAILHFGNCKWKEKPGSGDNPVESEDTDCCQKVSHLLGIDLELLVKGLLYPRVKVGDEYVNKGQNVDQVLSSISALSKSIYSRCFGWLVEHLNEKLDAKESTGRFIGVLDISGFDIFEFNGFEQLCINYANEKLQQFFNQYTFVWEQEQYKSEKIAWQMMSFGQELDATIELIEKPTGVFSSLDEESIVPKGTDATFKEKLFKAHARNSSLSKASKSENHFNLSHYAGVVNYSVNGWIDQNKDAVNTTVAELFMKSKTNSLLSFLFRDFGGFLSKSKKTNGLQTVSSCCKDQISKLMLTLKNTRPHFVRCIIPNTTKTPGILEPNLVLKQIACNGLLEGARIYSQGFPDRLLYSHFQAHFGILAPNLAANVDSKKTAEHILKAISMEPDLFKLGSSKVFFRRGVLDKLEGLREASLTVIIVKFQARIRAFLAKKRFRRAEDQRVAMLILRRNSRKYLSFKCWQWWDLYIKVKPLLIAARQEYEINQKAIEFEKLREALESEELLKKEVELKNAKLAKEKGELNDQLKLQLKKTGDVEQQLLKVRYEKADLESQMKSLEDEIIHRKLEFNSLLLHQKTLEETVKMRENDLAIKDRIITKKDSSIKAKDAEILAVQTIAYKNEDLVAKLERDKKQLEDTIANLTTQLSNEGSKNDKLGKLKNKLEQSLDQCELNLEHESKLKNELDKTKRKLEKDLISSQVKQENLEKIVTDLEISLKNKDSEIKGWSGKFDEMGSFANSLQKKLKDQQYEVEVANQELTVERQLKIRAEMQREDSLQQLSEMTLKLEQVMDESKYQREASKRRDSEYENLKKDLERMNLHNQIEVSKMNKKHQSVINQQIDMKEKYEKLLKKLENDKESLKRQVNDYKLQIERNESNKLTCDKLTKQLEEKIQQLQIKQEHSNNEILNLCNQKAQLKLDYNELFAKCDNLEADLNREINNKSQTEENLKNLRQQLEAEVYQKKSFYQQWRNLQQDLDTIKSHIIEEKDLKLDFENQLLKERNEFQVLKSKTELEAVALIEEIESIKAKLASKMVEAEENAEQIQLKCYNLEKTKQKLQCDIDCLLVELEKANKEIASLEKKHRQTDKVVLEWKQKYQELHLELEASKKVSRQNSADLASFNKEYEEKLEEIKFVECENKNLTEELRDLNEKLQEKDHKHEELENLVKRLSTEKQELQNLLENTESALDKEVVKTSKAQMELDQLQKEFATSLIDEEAKLESVKQKSQWILESMQLSLDTESEIKGDLLRKIKQKEGVISELLKVEENTKSSLLEQQKMNRNLQNLIDDLKFQVSNGKDEIGELKITLEESNRRSGIILSELEDVRKTFQESEKLRKRTEDELNDLMGQNKELVAESQRLACQKRLLEKEIGDLKIELDEGFIELRTSELTAKSAMDDASRLDEELKREQENSLILLKEKKSLEQEIKNLQVRLEDSEELFYKDNKRLNEKLEKKLKTLESDFKAEQRYHHDSQKDLRIYERRLKELTYQAEQDRQDLARLQEANTLLQKRLAVYKRQTEEAEEIAGMNINKYRTVQRELEDMKERMNEAETYVARVKSRARSSISEPKESVAVQEFDLHTVRASSVFMTRSSSIKRMNF